MVLTGLVLALVLASGGETGFGWGGRIAVLSVDGVIADDTQLLEQVRDFRNDPSSKGLSFRSIRRAA